MFFCDSIYKIDVVYFVASKKWHNFFPNTVWIIRNGDESRDVSRDTVRQAYASTQTHRNGRDRVPRVSIYEEGIADLGL